MLAVKKRYAFITSRLDRYSVVTLCQTPEVHRSGFYAWLKQPASPRQQEDERLTGLVKQSGLESGAVYGYRKIHRDLRDWGEACSKHRVAKLVKRGGLRSQTGYQRRKGHYGGKSPQAAPNTLARQFNVPAPNRPTLPTSALKKGGCTWRWCSICFLARSSAGR